jgi:hypothetical protein
MSLRPIAAYLFTAVLVAALAPGCGAVQRGRYMRSTLSEASRAFECPEAQVRVTESTEPDRFEVDACGVTATFRCSSYAAAFGQQMTTCGCDRVHTPGGFCPHELEAQESRALAAAHQERERREAARPVCWDLAHQGGRLDLHGIWGDHAAAQCRGEDCVFAVGESGLAVHYDGESWMEMRTPTHENLLAVTGRSRRDVFAVGRAGVVLHWNGRDWRRVRSETRETLWDVTVHAGDVWAVGAAGTVLRYDGRVFRREEVGVPADVTLSSVRGQGDRLVAVGNTRREGGDGVVLTRARGRWSVRSVPEPLQSVLVEQRGVIAASHRGRVLRVNGAEPDVLVDPEPGSTFSGLFLVRAGSTLLVGGLLRGAEEAGFEPIATPSRRILHDAWVARRDLVLAVGREGRIFRYDGTCSAP